MLERDFKLNVVLVKADELHVTSHHYKKHVRVKVMIGDSIQENVEE